MRIAKGITSVLHGISTIQTQSRKAVHFDTNVALQQAPQGHSEEVQRAHIYIERLVKIRAPCIVV